MIFRSTDTNTWNMNGCTSTALSLKTDNTCTTDYSDTTNMETPITTADTVTINMKVNNANLFTEFSAYIKLDYTANGAA